MARFLFAEDDPMILDICSLIAAMAGHVIDGAADGNEASLRVKDLEYDGIITDGMMPGMDGPQFLQQVRSQTRNRVPTAIKSAMSQGEAYNYGRDLGVEDYYPKQGRDGRSMIELLAAGFDRLLDLRVTWLITSQTGVLRPRTSPQHWVDFEALDALLRLDASFAPGHEQEEDGARVLRAPSPRAAVNALAGTVRDWFSLLEPSGVKTLEDLRDAAGAAGAPTEMDGQIDQAVRLGDEAIRRAAASVEEPHRTRILLALCCTRHGWQWPVAKGIHLTVDDPVEEHQEEGVYHCERGPALLYRDGWGVYALRGLLVPAHVVMRDIWHI